MPAPTKRYPGYDGYLKILVYKMGNLSIIIISRLRSHLEYTKTWNLIVSKQQGLLTLPVSPEFTPWFSDVRVSQSLVFYVAFR